ncbi:hypothetical protein [Sorangium sp. So ce513]|uniref:hypothetical protein n=1 Tax=Sorangium sp. So ce513 TaxID=3133315 RepID=UPI003F63219D
MTGWSATSTGLELLAVAGRGAPVRWGRSNSGMSFPIWRMLLMTVSCGRRATCWKQRRRSMPRSW